MIIASWNVNGIRAVHRKKNLPWDMLPEADVISIQEAKGRPDQVPESVASPEGYHSLWFPAQKPGYSGVAFFCRSEPDGVLEGLGEEAFDVEGRVLTVVFGPLAIVGAYFPNSQEKGKRIDYKLAFCAAMERHLQRLRDDGLAPVLVGDYNIAHQPIDLARPESNHENPGYLPEERAWMSHYLQQGFCDPFRDANPDLAGAYTWWTYRGGARARNVGWRIDYATIGEELADQVRDVQIHPDVLGSDHCPVSIELEVD
jgi:exodeoxyribonuclease-3